MHLAICDFDETAEIKTHTQTDANNLIKQQSITLRFVRMALFKDRETSLLEQGELGHYLKSELSRVSRIRLHLFTNRLASNRIELDLSEILGVTTETLIWDLDRMYSFQVTVGSKSLL